MIVRTEKHGFHIVDPSLWPLVTATGAFGLTSGAVMYMHGFGGRLMVFGLSLLLVGMIGWFRDVIREGTYEGQHTSAVQVGLRLGMILFIVSEVMFFVSFFWAYFWSSMSVGVEVGGVWPPVGIKPMNEFGIPLYNTLILLTSGASITWAHHGIVVGERDTVIKGLLMTVVLAILFTGLQLFEYLDSEIMISDGVYGSTFYMATGFHGFHVIIGTIMICVALVRVIYYQGTRQHHVGFESAAWYWHFVDVVWLFLFVAVYCWGS